MMREQTEKYFQSPDLILKQFADRHSLILTEALEYERLAIYWTTVANILVHDGYSQFDDEFFQSEPTVGILLNMLDRTFEHVEAAIVAFTTGSGSSCEVIARPAMEASVNLLFILSGDKVARLHSYFSHYLEGVDEQIGKWIKATAKMLPREAEAHREGADRRKRANETMKSLVEHVMAEMRDLSESKIREKWPNIAERFKAIEQESAHRTVYARMCSQTHNDAEETLRYFYAVTSGNSDLMQRIGIETVYFSRFMLYFAVSFFLLVSARYAKSFYMVGVSDYIQDGINIIDNKMQEIAKHVGAF